MHFAIVHGLTTHAKFQKPRALTVGLREAKSGLHHFN